MLIAIMLSLFISLLQRNLLFVQLNRRFAGKKRMHIYFKIVNFSNSELFFVPAFRLDADYNVSSLDPLKCTHTQKKNPIEATNLKMFRGVK